MRYKTVGIELMKKIDESTRHWLLIFGVNQTKSVLNKYMNFSVWKKRNRVGLITKTFDKKAKLFMRLEYSTKLMNEHEFNDKISIKSKQL